MENSSFSAAAASGHPAAALVAFSQANEALRLSARPFPPQVPIYANYHLAPTTCTTPRPRVPAEIATCDARPRL